MAGGLPAHLVLHLVDRWMGFILRCQFRVLLSLCLQLIGFGTKVRSKALVVLSCFRSGGQMFQFVLRQQFAVVGP